MTNPIYAYGRSDNCRAVTGAAFVPNGVWPASYDGSYLFGDFTCGKIFQLLPSGAGAFSAQEFASLGPDSIVSMTFGPSPFGRSLYYASYGNGGEVRRIDYTRSASSQATFTVKASGDDGNVTSAGPTYPPAGPPVANTDGTVTTAGRRFFLGRYENLVSLLRFDTSALPDNANILSATLRLYVSAKADADNRTLIGEWYPSSEWPIDPSDYALTSPATALAGADITQLAVGTTNDLPLIGLGSSSAAGAGSISTTGATSISTAGYSALRLQVAGDQPAGDNYVQIASFDDPTRPEPQLIVTYNTPTAVLLSSFNATPTHAGITLSWRTATELDLLGFNIKRSTAANGPYQTLNHAPIPAKAQAATGASYHLVDRTTLPRRTYFYRLEVLTLDGRHRTIGPTRAPQAP
jgi:hypothetical protein